MTAHHLADQTFSTRYQIARKCVGGERPGARALQNYLLTEIDKLEGCETIDSGIYNCRPVRGGTARSTHSEGRAGDLGVRTPEGMWPTKEIKEPGIRAWCDRLIDHADELGIQYVIYARQSRKPGQKWVRYTGSSPHFDHIHWEMTREAAEALTPDMVARALGTTKPILVTAGEAMTITEFLELAFWEHDQRKPDPSGYHFWLREFAAEKGSATWGLANYEASKTAARLAAGFKS